MTTRTDTTFSVRQDRRLIRPTAHSKRFVARPDRRRRARPRERAPAAGQPRHRPRPLGLDVRRRSCDVAKRGRRGGDRPAPAGRPVQRRRLRRRRRRRRRVDAGVGRGAPRRRRAAARRSRRAAARTSARAGCAAASRSPAHLAEPGVNRCLLLTDGLANVGITDADELADAMPAELRARGVSTSTFGVGNDFDERLLQDLADAGGGHFYYIADAPQIRDAITSEVGETLEIVARDVDARDHRARRHPDRADQPVPCRRARRPDRGRARRPRLGAGRRGRPAAVVPVRRARPETGRHRRPDRPRRRVRAGRRPADAEPVG